MKNSNDQKVHHSAQRSHSKNKENNLRSSQTSIGLALDKYEQDEKDTEDAKALKILKDDFRSNATGTDDDLGVDIQDAIGRDESLSLVADNIRVTVEDDIVTLEGGVFKEQERMVAGDVATALAGEDNVNNYLRVSDKKN